MPRFESDQPNLEPPAGYHLRLADGQSWNILYHPNSQASVNKLAQIMRLPVGTIDSANKLIYSRRQSDADGRSTPSAPVSELGIPDSHQWQAMDLGWLVIWKHKERPEFLCDFREVLDYREELYALWNSLLPIHYQTALEGGIPIHGALIERQGVGFIIAAPGGTGKSTSSRRLPEGFRTLSDDVAVVVKVGEGDYHAHPFPTWSDHILRRSDRTWDAQEHTPLKALFFLKRSETDSIQPVGQGHVAALIHQAAMQICHIFTERMDVKASEEFKKILFTNSSTLARTLPGWILNVSLTGAFWIEIEKALGYSGGRNG